MKRVLRVITMIAVLLGIVGLAQNKIAWAANLPEKTNQTTLQTVERTVSLDKGDYCDKPWNKRKEECKDKDKDKDKCKNHKKDCGSVKPPPKQITITVTGEYSVGGFCTLSITLNDPTIKLDAGIKSPLPHELPYKVQKVRQGCLLTYYSSNNRINELTADMGSTTICFAATPGKKMTLYFYNIYSPNPEWVALETTTQAGRACAPGNASGVYVAAFRKP